MLFNYSENKKKLTGFYPGLAEWTSQPGFIELIS